MPGPEDRILREKEDYSEDELEVRQDAAPGEEGAQNGADVQRFEELSRLARERDYAELEQRRQRALMGEAEYKRLMADYRAAVDQLENDLGMKIEDIERLHTVARMYDIRDGAYEDYKSITNRRHLFFGLVERLRQSQEPEEVKKQEYDEGIFELARKDHPWLKNWSTDALKMCFGAEIPHRPRREDTVGEKSGSAYEAELEAERQHFYGAFNELRELMHAYDKEHPGNPQTEAEKKLEKFWDQLWKVNNATSSDLPHDIIREIRSVLTPKEPFGSGERPVSDADKLLDIYFDYLQTVHNDQDPTELVPTEEEKHILDLLYHGISGMTRYADMLEEATCGTLEVPPAEQETENGKKIHRVNAVGKAPKLTEKALSEKDEDAGFQMNYRDARFEPLFRFSPKPSDVMQGSLGDCYFVASLAAIAAQNPSIIRNAMRDNRDGTVTVRLFTDNCEPVYVTVDKAVPRVNGQHPYAQNQGESLWVQIMERAFVQSGLHITGGLAKAEAGTLKSSYADIEGGLEWRAISMLIGTEGSVFSQSSRIIDTPKPGSTNSYTQKELDFVNGLKDDLANGQLLTASFGGSRKGLFGTPLDKKHANISGIDAKEAGIYTRHAYSLSAVEEENGKYYITVRNPHGRGGVNTLADGSLIAAGAGLAEGYSRLELRDFSTYFDSVSINSVDLTAAMEERLPEAGNLVHHYGGAVSRIAETLRDTDSSLLYFNNSEAFRAFRDAALSLDREMQKKIPSEKKLNEGLERFFEKARAYSDHCEKEKEIDPFKDSYLAQRRYQAAKIALEMKSVYDANKGKTLRDAWNEFSYPAAEHKVNVPVTPKALLGVYRKASDNMAKRFELRTGDFANRETRNKMYTFLNSFAEDGSAEKLQRTLAAQKSEGARFDCIRKNARTVCTMQLILRHGEKILRAMEADGVELENGKLKSMLLAGEGMELTKNQGRQKDRSVKNRERGITL